MMKKLFVFIALWALLLPNAYSQYAFMDAKELRDSLVVTVDGMDQFKADSASVRKLTGILRNYLSENYRYSTDLTDQQVLDRFKENPFFGEMIQSVARGGAEAGMSGFISNTFSQVKNLDVTNVADGLAQFMVERAKEELNIAFFERFKEYMNDPRYSDVRILFPQTYLSLAQIDTKIYNLNNYIQLLREAMLVDLVMLIENANTMIEQEKFQSFWEAHPELELVVRMGLTAGAGVQNGSPVGDLLTQLSEVSYRPSGFNANFHASMQVANLFSQSLRDGSPDYWVSVDELKRGLFSESIRSQLYLGLLFENFRQARITFITKEGKDFPAEDIFVEVAGNYTFIAKFLLKFGSDLEHINTSIQQLQQPMGNPGGFVRYGRLFNCTIDLIETSATLTEIIPTGIPPLISNAHFKKFVVIARSTSNIAVNLSTKQYASAVVNFAVLMDSVFDFNLAKSEISGLLKEADVLEGSDEGLKSSRFASNLEEGANSYLAAPSESWSDGVLKTVSSNTGSESKKATNIVARINELIRILNTQQSIQLFLQYGTFAANLVRAESAAEVKGALESAALPVGSYRIKRQTAFNISLNGYVGATGGVQFGDPNNSFVMGAWAPVGPAFSFGNFKQKKNSSSISIFIPIIDIGALALFRTSDDSTTIQTKIYLNQIFAPGLFVSWGLPKLPISLSAGYQIAPLLQSVETGQTVLSPKNNGRVVFTIAVDIPLFNIYNAPERGVKAVRVGDN